MLGNLGARFFHTNSGLLFRVKGLGLRAFLGCRVSGNPRWGLRV